MAGEFAGDGGEDHGAERATAPASVAVNRPKQPAEDDDDQHRDRQPVGSGPGAFAGRNAPARGDHVGRVRLMINTDGIGNGGQDADGEAADEAWVTEVSAMMP
ncbi:MAG: hypothetical protein R3D80_04035 [Paracoccaceae bacterium]